MSKKSDKPQVTYPFQTKTQIASRLRTDDEFVGDCLDILAERTRNRDGQKSCGFMSSHEKRGMALAGQDKLEGDDLGAARALCVSYVKQLAAHFRKAEIVENPELAEVAKIFSAS